MARGRIFSWLDIHQAVSLFFLPLVLIYTLTGVFDIFDFHRPEPFIDSQLDMPANVYRDAQEAAIRKFLEEAGVAAPGGRIRYYERSIFWGPRTALFVGIDLNPEGGPSRIRVFEPNLYYRLLALHKNQGGSLFNYFTWLFAAAHAVVYLSALRLFFKKYRRTLLWSLGGGIAATLLFVCLG